VTSLEMVRAQALLQLVNHGSGHRATVLQALVGPGASNFSQGTIFWPWEKK